MSQLFALSIATCRPMVMDYADYCTSAVEVVHSTILTEMVIDGTFDDIYKGELGKLADLDCATQYEKMQDTTLQLTGQSVLRQRTP
jgi:hypothetical protein